MEEFRVVPDAIWNREPPTKRGRKPTNKLSKMLLTRKSVFYRTTEKKTWGNIYRLAKNHGYRARIRQTSINDEKGYLMKFFKDEDTNEDTN